MKYIPLVFFVLTVGWGAFAYFFQRTPQPRRATREEAEFVSDVMVDIDSLPEARP